MTHTDSPTDPLWSTAQILAALLLIGTVLTLGWLPLTLLFMYLTFLVSRFLIRSVLFSLRKSRDGVKHMAALRRSERLKTATRQAQALVQIAPQITAARDYGEVAGLLKHIPGIKSQTISALTAINAAEQKMLECFHAVQRGDPQSDQFTPLITAAQQATSAFLKALSEPPALPAPELARGWLSFHEETRMSVQEIQNSLAALADKATAVATLQAELVVQKAQTPEKFEGKTDTRPLDLVMADLNGQLAELPENTNAKTFQALFELSQSIDAAFTAADRQPPHKLGLVADDVRRVHQVETLLSVYREKMEKLDQEKQVGKVDPSTYDTMKSAWERMLEGELAALEAIE